MHSLSEFSDLDHISAQLRRMEMAGQGGVALSLDPTAKRLPNWLVVFWQTNEEVAYGDTYDSKVVYFETHAQALEYGLRTAATYCGRLGFMLAANEGFRVPYIFVTPPPPPPAPAPLPPAPVALTPTGTAPTAPAQTQPICPPGPPSDEDIVLVGNPLSSLAGCYPDGSMRVLGGDGE